MVTNQSQEKMLSEIKEIRTEAEAASKMSQITYLIDRLTDRAADHMLAGRRELLENCESFINKLYVKRMLVENRQAELQKHRRA
jgi:hypothetical protein